MDRKRLRHESITKVAIEICFFFLSDQRVPIAMGYLSVSGSLLLFQAFTSTVLAPFPQYDVFLQGNSPGVKLQGSRSFFGSSFDRFNSLFPESNYNNYFQIPTQFQPQGG